MNTHLSLTTTDHVVGDVMNLNELSSLDFEQPRVVTTSWDDGDPHDLMVARMLTDFKLPGTFYIPVKGHHGRERMDRADVQSLDSQGLEIGAHGVSHPNLAQCDQRQLAIEVETSKKRMEDDLGKEVPMFAYPRGRHSSKVIASVKQAGFAGARTTAMLAREMAFDPFRMPTTVQVFPHSTVEYARNLARAGNLPRAWRYWTRLRRAAHWVDLAMLMFDDVMDEGGVWHLFGHSWEISSLKLWDELKMVLNYVANRPQVTYLPNCGVAEIGAA